MTLYDEKTEKQIEEYIEKYNRENVAPFMLNVNKGWIELVNVAKNVEGLENAKKWFKVLKINYMCAMRDKAELKIRVAILEKQLAENLLKGEAIDEDKSTSSN